MNFSIVNDIKKSTGLPKLTVRLGLEEKKEIDEITQRIIGFIDKGIAEATVQFSKLFDTLTLDDSDRIVDGITVLPEGWGLDTADGIYRYGVRAREDIDFGINLYLPIEGVSQVTIFPVDFYPRTRFGFYAGLQENQIYKAVFEKLKEVNDNPAINIVFFMDGQEVDLKNMHGNNRGIRRGNHARRYVGYESPQGNFGGKSQGWQGW